MYACFACMYVCLHACAGALGGNKMASDLSEQEFQMVVKCFVGSVEQPLDLFGLLPACGACTYTQAHTCTHKIKQFKK